MGTDRRLQARKQLTLAERDLSASPVGSPGNRLQLMETFVRIVEAGSLSAAAALRHATQPTVSRRLQSLEQSLGVRLLQRSTHTMRLTVDGERCFQRGKELLASWASFEADIQGGQEDPRGTLRVAVPHAFGQEVFVGPLAKFMRTNPRVEVEWLLVDDVRDFIGSGIDCAIQVGEPTDPSVVAIRLAKVDRIVVAAPSLLHPCSAFPAEPEDLLNLPWLALKKYYRREVALKHVSSGESRQISTSPRVTTDSLYALHSAALLGLGAYVGSTWMLSEDLAHRRLVQLAPQWQPAQLPVFLSYPYARFYQSRLQRFVSIMRKEVPALLGSTEP